MITCTRTLEFDAAHRIYGHESKCRTLHGHRYKVEITVKPMDVIDKLGRVVDFSVIKEKVGGWIDEYWDHNTIVYSEDTELLNFLHSDKQALKSPYVLNCNPTAENMAKYLINIAISMLKPSGVDVTKIRIYETPNCYSEATQ